MRYWNEEYLIREALKYNFSLQKPEHPILLHAFKLSPN